MFGKNKKLEKKTKVIMANNETVKSAVGREVVEQMKYEQAKPVSQSKTKLAKAEGKKIKVVGKQEKTKSILKNTKNQHSSEYKESGKFSQARDAKRYSGVKTRGVDMQEKIKNHKENKPKKSVSFKG